MTQSSPVTELLNRAEHYVNCNAAESGADILIVELADALRSFHHAQRSADPVQDTWLVGGPDLKAMSGSVESDRIIQLHFRRPATDHDRKWLLDAINAKIVADQAALTDTSTIRHGACQVCGEPADLKCGPSRFGDETWACSNCWEPDTRPDREGK